MLFLFAQYEKVEKIGEGTYGVVYKVRRMPNLTDWRDHIAIVPYAGCRHRSIPPFRVDPMWKLPIEWHEPWHRALPQWWTFSSDRLILSRKQRSDTCSCTSTLTRLSSVAAAPKGAGDDQASTCDSACPAGEGQRGWQHHCSEEDPPGTGRGGYPQHSHSGDFPAEGATAA